MDFNIRKSTKEDMPAVLYLIKELADYEKMEHEVEITSEDLIKEGFGKDPLFDCFIAEKADGEVVGMALIYFRFSTWKGKTLHLEDLMVKKEYRGEGLGIALYSEVIKFGASHGVKRIEWIVLDWNKNAIKFYEDTGASLQKQWYTVQMDEEGIKKFVENL
jgi:GNAT superfamily N-acetyltransferase|tara:strand:+ start:85974 stop:86456 length:483 start_codon:yes stop_codon:yes gene_type:complete